MSILRRSGKPEQTEYERRAALPAPDLERELANGSSDTQRCGMRIGSNSSRRGCVRLTDQPRWPAVGTTEGALDL